MTYLDVSKCTTGPWRWNARNEDENAIYYGVVISDSAGVVCSFGGTEKMDWGESWNGTPPTEADAALIAEAGTVAHLTGKGPKQLADELAEAEELLRRFRERHLESLANQEGQSLLRMDMHDLDDFLAQQSRNARIKQEQPNE
jgi:hypothetical protein